jgi:hypothetical protein
VNKLAIQVAVSAALIGAAASAAFAINTFVVTSRQGPTIKPRFEFTYKYKVKGSRSKGSARFHTSVGTASFNDTEAAFRGQFEIRNDERPTFPMDLYAPVGTGKTTTTTLQSKFNSKKLPPEESQLNRDEFGFAVQRLDDDIGGHSNAEFKKAPVSINGTLQVELLKVSGKIREKRSQYSGSFKYSAKGTVTTGENAGKKFVLTIKAKLRNAPVD